MSMLLLSGVGSIVWTEAEVETWDFGPDPVCLKVPNLQTGEVARLTNRGALQSVIT